MIEVEDNSISIQLEIECEREMYLFILLTQACVRAFIRDTWCTGIAHIYIYK